MASSRGNVAFGLPFEHKIESSPRAEFPPEVRVVLNTKCFCFRGTIIEEIERRAVSQAEKKIQEPTFDPSVYDDKVLTKLMSELKENTNKEGISEYDCIVHRIMCHLDPFNMRRFFPTPKTLVHPKEIDTSLLPRGVPQGLRRQAEAITVGKLKDAIGEEEYLRFLALQIIQREIRKIKADLKFAGEKVGPNFAGLMFELRGLSVAPTVNESLLRQEIKKVIEEGNRLFLFHIKSLRYTYPRGKSLKVLDHLNEVISPGIGKELRVYPGEEAIFERLTRIVDLFGCYGVETKPVVLISDNDLEILFPEGNSLVSQAEIRKARGAVKRYIQNLKAINFGLTEEIFLLTDFLDRFGLEGKYNSLTQKIVRELRIEKGGLIKNSLIETRVNHQFEHYREMFGSRYTRAEARFTAYNQIANLMALSVVFEGFPGVPVVVVDDRGQENNLISGYQSDSAAIFFAQLKDKTVIKKC